MKRILLVISDEKHRKALGRILAEGGYEVSSNSFVDDLQGLVRSFDPVLLLIDGLMVESFGAGLRQNFPRLPVLAWMNERNAQLAVGFISAGALDCLCPPLEYFEVLGVVRHALNQTVTRDDPIPEPKRNYLPLIKKLAAVVALLAAVAAYLIIDTAVSSRSRTYVLTYQNPTGIFWEKNRLWTADWYTQSVYQYKAGKELKLQKIYPFTEFGPNAVAVIHDALWVAAIDGFIRTYRVVNNVPVILNSFRAPGYSPTGLCVQKQFLWTADTETNKIYQHPLGNPDEVVASFDYPGVMPVGLYWDGKYFWSADGKTNKVHRHWGPERKFAVAGTYALAPEGGGMIAGMGGDGKNLWLIYTGQPARVLRYPLRLLRQ